MRKIASFRISVFACGSSRPRLSKYAILPWRAISSTAPGISLAAILARNISVTRPSRSEERPTSSGLASGRLSAAATEANATHTNPRGRMAARIILFMAWSPLAERSRWLDLCALYSEFYHNAEDVEHPSEVWVDAWPGERTVDQAVASGSRPGRFRSLQMIPIRLAPSVFVDDIGQRDAADWP